jgi:hypothetical protein
VITGTRYGQSIKLMRVAISIHTSISCERTTGGDAILPGSMNCMDIRIRNEKAGDAGSGYLQVVQLGSRMPSGSVSYHQAFTTSGR